MFVLKVSCKSEIAKTVFSNCVGTVCSMFTIEKNKGNYSYLCLFMYFAFVVGVLHFGDVAEVEQA